MASEKWAEQHTKKAGWADHYFGSRDLLSRSAVLDALREFEWHSLLEVGCNSGPMLRRVLDEFPARQVTGMDVNPVAIEAAQRLVPEGTYLCADLMKWFPSQDEQWDIVMTHYTLAYVAPPDLKAVLMRMAQTARKGLVMAEPTAGPGAREGLTYPYPEWRHNYVRAFRSLGLTAEVTPFDPIGRLNAVVTVRLP